MIPGLITTAVTAVLLWFSVKKVMMLMMINCSRVAIIRLQEMVNRFNLMYITFRKWEFFFIPVLCMSMPPILWKSIKNLDAYEHICLYGTAMAVCVAVAFVTGYWLYYKWYDKKIKKACSFLEELREYNID